MIFKKRNLWQYFKQFWEKKSFDQAIKFVFAKPLKIEIHNQWTFAPGPKLMKLRPSNWPFPRLEFSYSHFPVTALFDYHDIVKRKVINIAANAKNFKMKFIIFKNYHFRIIIKNLTKRNIFSLACK